MGGGETAAGELGRHGRSNLAVEREVERKDRDRDSGLLVIGLEGRLGGGVGGDRRFRSQVLPK